MSTAYVVGGGLAGLSAAVLLAENGRKVELIEGAPQAGGRCRSYFDPVLGQVIDNGNHLVLSGNHCVRSYLRSVGADSALVGPDRAEFNFADLSSGAKWTIRPNESAFAWWILSSARRVPDTDPFDYLALLSLLLAGTDKRISDVIRCEGPLWDRLMQPFLLAALNSDPGMHQRRLAGAVIRETLAKGGHAYHPRIAHPTLAAAFVDPGTRISQAQGCERADRSTRPRGDVRRIAPLGVAIAGRGDCESIEGDTVILAVPPWVATELVPGLTAPTEFCSIVNAHFTHRSACRRASHDRRDRRHWRSGYSPFRTEFRSRSAARTPSSTRTVRSWPGRSGPRYRRSSPAAGLPPWQIVKEQRATFAATPEQAAKRPKTATRWPNLLLAGDWTDTGLPATIEGAIRSGQKAARLVLSRT